MSEPNKNQNFQFIIDNKNHTVADFLRQRLGGADLFRVVSAYFSIYGFEALQAELASVGNTRLLFGDPASVAEIATGQEQLKRFLFEEGHLLPSETLRQKALACACEEWIEKGTELRTVSRANFLHGKLYHITSNSSQTVESRGVPGAGLPGAAQEKAGKRQLFPGAARGLSSAVQGMISGNAAQISGNAALVGSSNFTRRGLGVGAGSNLEINVAAHDGETTDELKRWFDALWQDEHLTRDAKQDVLDALKRLGKEQSPEFIYFKTLYTLFKEDIDARAAQDGELKDMRLYESGIWQALYDFQREGAQSVINRLLRHGGCILADSVGLGKTYTALAVIKFFEMRNENVLVLCPKKLRENWSLYQASANHSANPFPSDRFSYHLLSHSDLSRKGGQSGGINLANFNWGNFGLVVIDESHNFRNISKNRFDEDGNLVGRSRYDRLLQDIIKDGTKTKTLMLSATPVNTSLTDLRNQIYLMTEKREDAFHASLGISDFASMLNVAQKKFRKWESDYRANRESGIQEQGVQAKKADLLEALGGDFLRLLCGVSIARSRRHIRRYYSSEIARIGDFPKVLPPENLYPDTDIKRELSYEELHGQIDEFRLSIYRPSAYLIDGTVKTSLEEEKKRFNFNQIDRERWLIGMIRVNFLKRLESSPHSLLLTLDRTIGRIDEMIKKIERFQASPTKSDTHVVDDVDFDVDEEEEDDEFVVNKGKHPYKLSQIDGSRWLKELRADRGTLDSARQAVARITPDRDGKLAELKKALVKRKQNPTTTKDGVNLRKLLVFTTFKDTALYLWEQVQSLAQELGLQSAMVSGTETRTTAGANSFQEILTNFAPRARNRASNRGGQAAGAKKADIDLLIATDCISEGQNLQDCDMVINYDIHWNPVRIIQRFGRIDRIGSRHSTVRMLNFWPTEDMNLYLKLEGRVRARMALADTAATGDENRLDETSPEDMEQQVKAELNFRDDQLLQLKGEIKDFEDLDDGVTMSDFTFDDYQMQLQAYLEENRAKLDEAPNGLYAVANACDNEFALAEEGAFFLLRLRTTPPHAATQDGDATQDGAAAKGATKKGARSAAINPLSPHYLAYVRKDGTMQYGCLRPKQILNLLLELTGGQKKPLKLFCDQFDRETDSGRIMTRYETMLEVAIKDFCTSYDTAQAREIGSKRAFKLAEPDQKPHAMEQFELVTWLVVKDLARL